MAKAASRCCELANPAQVRQIASQTEDLLRRMRFVAGRGAVAELLAGSAMVKRMEALWRRAIGKMLLAGGAAGGMEQSGSLNGRACRSAEDAAMQQMHRSSSAGRQKETASKHRSLAQKKQPGTEACDPNAGCARKITIRVNILLTLRPATREATTCGVARPLRSNNLRSSPPPAKQQTAEQPATCEATTCEAARRRGAKRYLKKSSSRYLGSGQSSSSIIISNLSALRRIFSIYGKTVLL